MRSREYGRLVKLWDDESSNTPSLTLELDDFHCRLENDFGQLVAFDGLKLNHKRKYYKLIKWLEGTLCVLINCLKNFLIHTVDFSIH